MQALKESPELHPAWREQAGLVGKGAHERANPECGWLWGARLSDSVDVSVHTPWKNRRTLGGMPHPEDLSHHASKTAYQHQSCNDFCWYLPRTNPACLHARAAGCGKRKIPLQKKGYRSVLVTQSQHWAVSCHRLNSPKSHGVPTPPRERWAGLVGGAGMETSRSAWTESKTPSYWDAPRHHCQYKHHYLELTLAQLLFRNYTEKKKRKGKKRNQPRREVIAVFNHL